MTTVLPPIDRARLAEIATIPIGRWNHSGRSAGGSVMELASYLAGEPWSDHPLCVSETIARFLRTWSNGLPDTDRTRLLRPLIPRVIGTAGSPALEQRRSWLALDWLIRVYTPAWLRAGLLDEHADALAALPEITDLEELQGANGAVVSATGAARGARGARGAWDVAVNAAMSAAWDAAWGAAWNAPRNAVWGPATDAWDAAWSAADASLKTPLRRLQASALDLVERMIEMKEATP